MKKAYSIVFIPIFLATPSYFLEIKINHVAWIP